MKVFMVSYGAGHCNVIAPVYNKLAQDKANEIVYLALTLAPLHLMGKNIKFITMSDMASQLPYHEKIKRLGTKYGTRFHNNESGIELNDTIAYYGVGMYDLINQYGENKAEEIFSIEGRKAFCPVFSMETILKILKPDVCVVTVAPRVEEATGIAAEKLKIPVVMINDMPDMLPAFYPLKFKCSLCVMNEWAKTFATNIAKVPTRDVYITGQPALEENFHVDIAYLDSVKEKIGLSHFGKLVTFFTQTGRDQSAEVQSIYDIAKKITDVMFIIKLHPNQAINTYTNELLPNVLVTRDDSRALYHLSDVAITAFSTTGMEAALLGVPLIVVNFMHEKYSPDYVDMGIATLCETKEMLEHTICSLLNNNSNDYKIAKSKQSSFQNVYNSAENVCKVIYDVAKR